jgi:hypothetical protein
VRKRTFFGGLAVAALVSGVIAVSTVAFAGSGIGGVFNLGMTNTANGSTALQGDTSGQQLRITNTNTGGNASGIGIVTPDNVPPLAVHSKARVVNLNADTVDGKHASQLVSGGGQIVRGRLVEPIPTGVSDIVAIPGIGVMEATCDTVGYELFWDSKTNPSAAVDDWWVAKGVSHYSLDPTSGTGDVLLLSEKTDQLVVSQVARAGHTATITTTAHWSATNCVFNAQAVIQ